MSFIKHAPEAVKRVLTEGFAARDVAELLASFDEETPAERVLAVMSERDFDVVGVRSRGETTGWVQRSDLEGLPSAAACGTAAKAFEEKDLLDENAPLFDVVLGMAESPRRFVRTWGRVGAIVTRDDLQKPAVRMWLFGMVTLIELQHAAWIEAALPDDGWKAFLSPGRVLKAEEIQAERRRRGQSPKLFDCLQFSDKGQIVARCEAIRRQTVFASRSQAEEAVKKLEQLRNDLAHSQDILAHDYDTIVRLARIVLRGLQVEPDPKSA